jgi:hypothetical protein
LPAASRKRILAVVVPGEILDRGRDAAQRISPVIGQVDLHLQQRKTGVDQAARRARASGVERPLVGLQLVPARIAFVHGHCRLARQRGQRLRGLDARHLAQLPFPAHRPAPAPHGTWAPCAFVLTITVMTSLLVA